MLRSWWVAECGGVIALRTVEQFGWSLGFTSKTEPEVLKEGLANAALWSLLAHAISLLSMH